MSILRQEELQRPRPRAIIPPTRNAGPLRVQQWALAAHIAVAIAIAVPDGWPRAPPALVV